MPNQFNMKCPECGSADELDVAALVWVRLVADGNRLLLRRRRWDDDSACQCAACGWSGTVLNASPGAGDA